MAARPMLTQLCKAAMRGRDGRSVWRVRRDCVASLQAAGTSLLIAGMAADAAQRLGEWLRDQKLPPQPGQ